VKLRILTLFSASLAVANAFGQSLFFDDFESYRENSSDYYAAGKFDYDAFEYDFDAGERTPKVVGPKDGVTPYSGNRMLDFRAANQPKTRTLKLGFDSKSDLNPHIQYSFRFLIPTTYQEDQRIFTYIDSANGPGSYAEFKTIANTFTGFGLANIPVALHRDTWNVATIDVNWPKMQAQFMLNGQVIAVENYGTGHGEPPYLVGPFVFGMVQNTDVSDKYSLQSGAPGMFVDDVSVVLVPEVTPFGALLIGFGAIGLVGRRGKAS